MEQDYMDAAFGPLVDVMEYKGHEIEVRRIEPDSTYLEVSSLPEGTLTYHCEGISEMSPRLEDILEKIQESISEQLECEERLINHG